MYPASSWVMRFGITQCINLKLGLIADCLLFVTSNLEKSSLINSRLKSRKYREYVLSKMIYEATLYKRITILCIL